MNTRTAGGLLTAVLVVAATATACSFDGLNSLPLPGTAGRGQDASTYHVELANVGTLESNSPVLINEVIVGSVGAMRYRDGHADVEISVQPGTVVPANVTATIGQTSLLGSMHLALNPPQGQPPTGSLPPGTTIGLTNSATYPSTEQTLSSLSVVVNGGGLGKVGDLVEEFNAALGGNEDQIRDLLTRLNDFVGVLDDQRVQINATITALNRLTGTLANQEDVITQALQRIPPALEVLDRERPQITTALEKFRVFSVTATDLITATHDDLVKNLRNLEPTVRALADVGPKLATVLAFIPTYPYPQNFIDRAIRGDYLNEFITFDLTIPRLKRGLFLGTRFGQKGAALVPAPGDPWYSTFTKDPLQAPLTAPPSQIAGPPPLVDAPEADPAAVEPGAPEMTSPVPAADSAAPPAITGPRAGGGS